MPQRSFPIECIRDQEIIVGEDRIDAHCAVAACLFGIVRIEDITADAVCMRLIDGFLIEIGLKELDLFTAVANGAIDDLPSSVTRAATARDLGVFSLQARKHVILTAHNVNVLLAIVFFDKRNNTVEILGAISLGLQMNIHYRMAGEFLEYVLKGWNLHSRERLSAFHTEIEFAELGERVIPYLTRTV